MEHNINDKISQIKGIGPKTEPLLNKLGIYTVRDMLEYYPKTYDLYKNPVTIGELEEGNIMATVGQIIGNITIHNGGKLPVTQIMIKDITGTIKVSWFRAPYLKNTLRAGQQIIVRGKVQCKNNQIFMEHPELFVDINKYREKINTLQPIYLLTKGVTNSYLTKTVSHIIDSYGTQILEVFREETLKKYHLLPINDAVQGVHFPENMDVFVEARNRFVFEEFLAFILQLRTLQEEKIEVDNPYIMSNIDAKEKVEKFREQLPYELTNAQLKVWQEIQMDVNNPKKTMSRLVQGDVGSGKTIVALLALLLSSYHGYQGAMMAPTEVLATQHYKSICEIFEEYDIPIKVEILTGSMSVKGKRNAYQRIENGEAQIIIGTHALIQEKVKYHKLALVITDEQHRFGVKQREILANKGEHPHVLVMSATPIPRTLAIILYGDLDISVIDELPANRLPIKNCVVGNDYHSTAYHFMKAQINEGRQCYVICPMVEESEHLEGENVIDYSKRLQSIMGDEICVDYLHGKMKQSQKDEIMNRYYKREIDILVSTTVIEVGINVPNASVMLIENAERFGLSGLHQLRGRVGRGVHQSYCIFMTSTKNKETKERLEILGKSNDGFYIANEDLKLRGPGDLFGIRQSGEMNFKLADIYQDAKILQLASEAAQFLSEIEYKKIMLKQEITSSVIL